MALPRHAARITKPPRNARGMVAYSTGISILRPVDMARGNHTLLYDVVNRGNKGVTTLMNLGASATDPGDGSEITGRVRAEYVLFAPATTRDVTAAPAYAAVRTSNAGATLTRRVHQVDAREPIPNHRWAFADCTATPFPGVPDASKVCLAEGFDTNHLYELVYTAKNPTVAGLGFAATRDLLTFLRDRAGDGSSNGAGNATADGPPNPLGRGITTASRVGPALPALRHAPHRQQPATLRVPLGTYAGWNVRAAGFSAGDACDLVGSFIPFSRTEAERRAAGDPRRSLAARYPTHAEYVARVSAAADSLVGQRLLRAEDTARIVSAAGAAAVP